MRKHINSTDKFIDVNTGTLVLDTTPTEGSFNAVTSDGVAKAIAQGGGGGGAGGDIYYVQGTDTPATIMAQVSAGKVPVIKNEYGLYYMANGNGSLFTRTRALGTNASGYMDGFLIEDTVATAIPFTNNIAPSFTPTTGSHRGDEGKFLTAAPGANGEMELSWADRSVYIIDFGDYGNWDTSKKQQTASLLNTLASSGTTIPVVKLDSIKGGDSHTPNARFLPLRDFYFSDVDDFTFTFEAPFSWWDADQSANVFGIESAQFLNAPWAGGFSWADNFYQGSFNLMNPAPHRP